MKKSIENKITDPIEKRDLVVFSLNEVYYWEPFWKILVDEEKLAHVCVEIEAKTSYSSLFNANVPHAEIDYCPKLFLSGNILKKYIDTFSLLLKHRKKNVLITQYLSVFNWYCLILSYFLGCNVLFKGESILLEGEKVKLLKNIYLKVFFFFCHEIFFSCSGNKRLFEKIVPRRALKPLLCFCDDIPRKYVKDKTQYRYQNKLNIVLCGSFYHIKNFEVIVEILDKYPKLIGMVKIHLIGSGEKLELIRTGLERLGADFTAYGYCIPKKVPKILHKFGDILLFPSARDNSPKIVNEAMTVGMPILISKNCGTTDDLIAEGKNGFTFDYRDVDEIAEYINFFINNPNKLPIMGGISKDIVSQFTAVNAARGFISVLN